MEDNSRIDNAANISSCDRGWELALGVPCASAAWNVSSVTSPASTNCRDGSRLSSDLRSTTGMAQTSFVVDGYGRGKAA